MDHPTPANLVQRSQIKEIPMEMIIIHVEKFITQWALYGRDWGNANQKLSQGKINMNNVTSIGTLNTKKREEIPIKNEMWHYYLW